MTEGLQELKVLVVDDEPFVLKLLARQLENLGCTDVTACERAHDALFLLESGGETFDLIFCDLQMPQMDGVEFVRRLVQLQFTGGLVLVSGEGRRTLQTAEKLASAHRLRMLGALHKPVLPEQLREVMERAAAPVAPSARSPRKAYSPGELRRAIEGRELINHYQPKVKLATGEVFGVEALVRWRHPEDGLVFPDQFITLAEEHELIDDLTWAVLENALEQAGRWRASGLDLQVAVNLSMDNLATLEFPDHLAAAVTEAALEPSGLMLEVTESRLMKDPLTPLDILTRLRLKRIGLSIDDFGTGYSSLAQLRDLPFEELKVDRGFVHGASRDSSLRAIVEASLGMARQLGMQTVAEGVEEVDDWHLLLEAGCDLAQGYLIGRPMPAEDLNGWMDEWEARRTEFANPKEGQ